MASDLFRDREVTGLIPQMFKTSLEVQRNGIISDGGNPVFTQLFGNRIAVIQQDGKLGKDTVIAGGDFLKGFRRQKAGEFPDVAFPHLLP